MRTFVPPTSFVSSPETEKERLLYASGITASGFYSTHGFVINSKPFKKFERYTVVLPEAIKNVSQKYWQEAASGGSLMPKIISPLMGDETKEIYLNPVNENDISIFQNDWKKIEQEAWSALALYFPTEIKWINSLEVRITNIGSYSSHNLLSKIPKQKLIINLRCDADCKEIVNLLTLSLIYPLAEELGLSFTHRQTLRNFIMSRNEFKKLCPDFKPKNYDNLKTPIKLRIKSDEYVKHLGIPDIADPVNIINKNIAIFGIKEEKLINLLIKNRNDLVNYDQIADCIWGEGKFKSYWAINKLTQRVQNKIKTLGINLQIIGTRGKGYVLK